MAKKVNQKLVLESLIETWNEGYDLVSDSYIQELGLDLNDEIIEIGNFRLEKRFLSLITKDYNLTIIDEDKDLMNNNISENIKLVNFIKEAYEDNYDGIKNESLHKFHFNTRLKKVDFSYFYSNYNFNLKKDDDIFQILISDSKKDIEGRFINDAITVDTVIHAIMEYEISEKFLSKSKELDINEDLVDFLKGYFVPVKKSSGNSSKYFDVVVGKDKVAIEIKLARELSKSNNYQRAIGQIEDYTDRLSKNDDLLFLIIGLKSEGDDQNIKLIEDKIKRNKRCRYFFKIAKK